MNTVIGLDIGTTDCKAIALDERGEVIASFQEKYELRVPRPGWAEQDCSEVWQAAMKALVELSKGVSSSSMLAIGLSGAMHSLVTVDEHDEPLAPAMTWADQRASVVTEALRKEADPIALYRRTGCPLQAIYFLARARWCVDAGRQKFARVVSIKELILHRLTGVWAIDFGMASTTGLLDIHSRQWDTEALSLARIEASQLSPLISSQALVGSVTPQAARMTGLPAGLPVVAGGSDGGMAMVGVQERTVITVGTSGAVRRIASAPVLDDQARTWCYVQDNGPGDAGNKSDTNNAKWLVGGAINNGGLAAQWAKEKFYPHDDFETMFHEVSEVDAGSAGVMCLPYLTGERSPYWNTHLRATLSGIGLEHSRAHIARAVLEGVAYCLADVWEILANVNGDSSAEHPGSDTGDTSIRLSGGITRSPEWSQIVCDVLGIPLHLTKGADASATGAAMIAWEARGKPINLPQEEPIMLTPDPSRHALYQELHRVFQERGRNK
jgi:gluconokinase